MDERLKQLVTEVQRRPPKSEGQQLILIQLVDEILRSRKICRPPIGQPLSGIYREIYEQVRQQLLHDVPEKINHYNPKQTTVRIWAGSILINDVPITQLNERERTLFRRDRIGFVFQFFNLIPTLTVLENVTLPLELAGHNRKEVEQKALNLLERVGLADRAQTFPDKLSGGQQQRVAIARALIHDPMLVLADEPTGNLDEETGDRVLKLLLDLTRSANKTLIMATHNPEIAKLADRVFRVHDGHLQEESIKTEGMEEVAA